MKVDQKAMVRWVAKLVTKGPREQQGRVLRSAQVLDIEQLRQVCGGTGDVPQGPNKGW